MLEEMVFVVGGVFEMGCKSDRDNITTSCLSNEQFHWVRVNNFYIGKYEVTQGLWKKVMGDLPSKLKSNSSYLGDDKPVVYVSYNDIAGSDGFLETLNAQTGNNYRLPTEAEWEYAARGCSGGVCENFEFSGGNTIGDVAWYSGNCPSATPQPVGGKRANALGIYDMIGNAWEWCNDWYDSYYGFTSTELENTTQTSPIANPIGPSSGSSYAARGGGWQYDPAGGCRIAVRSHNLLNYTNLHHGFRLVLPLVP
jgi:formylglycine-generating enzyme required for sulfatase activity